MTIEQAKSALDEGQTLELDLPSTSRYLAANYHVLMDKRKNYICTVHYQGEERRRDPIADSSDWVNFLHQLPSILQVSDEWIIM